jgi:hypothetical protein
MPSFFRPESSKSTLLRLAVLAYLCAGCLVVNHFLGSLTHFYDTVRQRVPYPFRRTAGRRNRQPLRGTVLSENFLEIYLLKRSQKSLECRGIE